MDNAIFVGRTAQLEQLNNHWRDTFHKKQGKVVFLTGEAGIGKTSLIEQFSRSVLKNYSNVQYAYAQCDQIAGDISPYAPFVQILNSLTEQAAKRGNNWFVSYMREVGPDVLGLVPVAGSLLAASAKSVDFIWQRRKQDRVAEAGRSRFGQQDLFQQFTDTFRKIATNKNPLLLCIDDWHWADTSSTNLLFHLARQVSDVPLLLLATYRSHDAEAREHPILNVRTEMERYNLCASLELDFLSRAEVESYLAQRFPKAHFGPEFIDWLLKTTSGNALFTTEYLSLLLNEKLLTPEGHLTGNLADLQPPANVEAVIRTRLGYLDREARDMLAYGSVEGEQFTTLVLSRLLEIKPLSLIRKLRAIEETHHLIASLGQQSVYEQQTTIYRFVHTLIYRTLYNILEAEERVEISRSMFELLEEIYKQSDEPSKQQLLPALMKHASEAKNHLAEARYALAAAERAAEQYAHPEVLKHCTFGLQALDKIKSTVETKALHIDLLLRRGMTQTLCDTCQQTLETYRQAEGLARSLQDEARLLKILMEMGWVLWLWAEYDQAQGYFEEAAPLAQQMNDRKALTKIYDGFGAVQYKQYNYDQALKWEIKSLTIAEELGDKAGRAVAHNALGHIYQLQGEDNQALKHFHRAMALHEETGNLVELGWSYSNSGTIYVHRSADAQALTAYQKALALWQETGYKLGQAAVSKDLGWFYLQRDDPDQALVWFQKAQPIYEMLGNKAILAGAYIGLGRTYRALGHYEQAFAWYSQALALNEELGDKRALAINYTHIALLHKDQGDTTQALAFLQKALPVFQEVSHRRNEAIVYFHLGTVYAAQGDYQPALEYYQNALAIREELGNQTDIEETRQSIIEVEAKLTEQQ